METAKIVEMLNARESRLPLVDREMNMGHSSDAYESSDDERSAARDAAKRADATAALFRAAVHGLEGIAVALAEETDTEERDELKGKTYRAWSVINSLLCVLVEEDADADAKYTAWVERMSRIEADMTTAESALDFELIFDNGGGVQLQTAGYVHSYDEGAQCARDVRDLLEDNSTDDWEGNQPEARLEYDDALVRNGGYKWLSRADVKDAIARGTVSGCWGRCMEDFFAELGVAVEE